MKNIKVAYCTGFWCTNIGNGFFSLGVEYALKKILGEKNVTTISDLQTYTTGYGKRLYPSKKQYEYITKLDVDYIVLAGPVLSKFFLRLWKNIIIELKKRNIGYIILSAGIMKMSEKDIKECQDFFKEYPPYIISSRDEKTYELFGKYAKNSYNGICFSFFTPDYYSPAKINERFWTYNFDKIEEPIVSSSKKKKDSKVLKINNNNYYYYFPGVLNKISKKTDRFTDSLIYIRSFFPKRKKQDNVDEYKIIRTDHRFHPHYRSKIYSQNNSYCADIPHGYINIYANSELTLSDRVHACAITLAYGNSAMLFSKTNRSGLLDRVGAQDIGKKPVKIDLKKLEKEKENMLKWLSSKIK